MARLSDHDVRDAEHALRTEIALVTGRYIRRMNEMGKAYIQERIEETEGSDEIVDGTAIGRAAAERAARDYFGGLAGVAPQVAIEGSAHRTETGDAAEDPGLRHRNALSWLRGS